MAATDVLTRDEIRRFTEPSDAAGWAAVATTWGLIAAALALPALWPHPVTIAVSLVILGGRHLALAVLMHESSHRSLFKSRRLGEFIGRWLCAAPQALDLEAYRKHHIGHHAHAGTDRDPDLALVKPFPATPRSMARKLARDIFGITGLKRWFGLTMMGLGVFVYDVSGEGRWANLRGRTAGDYLRDGLRNLGPALLVNGLLLAALIAAGYAWVFLLWIISDLTVYSLFLRIRSIAEHAGTEGGPDPRLHTRTTAASWLARLTVAPHSVNFHIEHHLLMTAPYHRLQALHETLAARGALDDAKLSDSYIAVLRELTV